MSAAYAFEGTEDWLTELWAALKGYADEALGAFANVNYDIRLGFPPESVFSDDERMVLDNVIIHFEIDDVRNPVFGFGDNVIQSESLYDTPDPNDVTEVEAQQHIVNFDVGIWATQKAGGETARLRAYQRLTHVFQGVEAYRDCSDKAGIQIKSFEGGQNIIETINDITVWRVAGMTLQIQVFNRRYKTPTTYIETITSEGTVHIDDTVIIEDD
jgi:hypothetical protein